MVRKTPTRVAGDPLSASRVNSINDDLDVLYNEGSDRMKARKTTGLNLQIGAGTFRVGATEGLFGGTIIVMPDNTTSYVMIDPGGAIVQNTTGWIETNARIAIVDTASGQITGIQQRRNDLVGGRIGGLAFQDTRAVVTIPNDYNDLQFKAQFKELAAIGLTGLASGIYCKLIGFRGWTDGSGGDAIEIAYCNNGISFIRSGYNTTRTAWRNNSLKDYRGGNPFGSNYVSGAVRTIPFLSGSDNLVTGTPTQNRLYYIPFIPSKDCNVTELGFRGTTGSSTATRLGIYDSLNDRPNNLIMQTSAVAVPTYGYRSFATNFDLEGGKMYWLAFASSGNCQYACVPLGSSNNLLGFDTGGLLGITHYYEALAGGTPFPANPTSLTSGTGTLPAIYILNS